MFDHQNIGDLFRGNAVPEAGPDEGGAGIGPIKSLAAAIEKNRLIAQEMKAHIVKWNGVLRHSLLVCRLEVRLGSLGSGFAAYCDESVARWRELH
jgi:hypothetical protein